MSKKAETTVTEKQAIRSLDQAYQWTHNGTEVLILKCVNKDGLSYSGKNKLNQQVSFIWPLTVSEKVEAPDWQSNNLCGGGLHGWAWGFGLGEGKDPDWGGKWIVFGSEPEDVIGNLESGQKCKARAGIIRFVGDWNTAMQFILAGQMALVAHITFQSTEKHTSGYQSASSATGYIWEG